jgi:two-component system OmpR family response regulator
MFFCFSSMYQMYYIETVTMPSKVLFINNVGDASLVPGLLTGNGYSVDMVFNPETGLRQLEIQSYHLVIVLESPVAESWVFCEKIRRLTGIPLIVISSNASTEACVKAINAGADYFMRKPFGPLELLARVGSLCQRASYRQPVSLVS